MSWLGIFTNQMSELQDIVSHIWSEHKPFYGILIGLVIIIVGLLHMKSKDRGGGIQ